MTRRRGRALAIIGSGIILLGAMTATFVRSGYRVNLTPSFPLGLWRIAQLGRPVRVGDTVFICPPRDSSAVMIGRKRHYLPRGRCPSGTAPLIKTVVAAGGQVVRIVGRVVVDGRPLARSRICSRDAAGRPMTVWPGGVVPEGEVFLHSDYVGSYDSRYFGPLPASGILGLAEPVLTFTP